MRKKLTSLLIAIMMLLQIFITPNNVLAEGDKALPQGRYVKVGEINAKSYDAKIMNELNRVASKNRKQSSGNPGIRLFSKGPYFGDNNEPKDADKPKYFGNVSANLNLIGLDGNKFQWNEIFGVDENGNPKPAQIIFRQMDEESSVDTGLYYMLQITKGGKYTWSDGEGNPTKLPLFSKSLKPYRYEVRIDERVSDKVELLTSVSFGTEGSSPTFLPENADGEIIANITLGLTYKQIASTKFISKWNTGLDESDRPDIEANFAFDDDGYGDSPVTVALPKNDKDIKIIRDWYNEFDPDLVMSFYLEKTPDVKIDESTDGLTFDTTNKTVEDGNHKFKYDFTYDVINGGKLTMTEIIPITFDANGGKFASITDENAKQEIIKEVDYDGTLTDKAETPTKPGKAFEGWATDKEGKTPATDDDFKNIEEKKTFYAIWSDEDIQVEELKTTESLIRFRNNRPPTITNDFVPTFDQLKSKVKVKDSNGDFVELPTGVGFSIVDDEGKEYTEDSVDLKKFIYEKVKENNKDEVSRTETVKAKITYDDGTTREVEIPIRVLRNIYKGTDEGNKYPHIPENYVKVTIDPTDKAQNPDKTYYYVNPKAKVKVPVTDPVGKGDNNFSKWIMKADSATGDGADYTKTGRYQFEEASTIIAQYGDGIIKIAYVDQNGNEIDAKYQIAGQDYPSDKSGGLGKEADELQFASKGPDFKGYIYSSRDSIKGKNYKDPANPDNLDIVTYKYYKKVTTDTPKNPNVYFPVIFDAYGGEFEAAPKDKKTVYVYFDGNDATVEKVTFKEVLDEFEKAYSNPTKDGFDFKEWKNAKTNGTKPADDYEIKFKGWDWDADPVNGYVPETFYAHYEQASAFIKYLDLDGKPIADEFKIEDQEYPAEKGGKAGENIAKDIFTKDNAPKFIGYKFNRIELNPANGKYAMDNKATIKIYYEKVPDVIPEKDGSGNPNEKPDGYVEVKFVPTDKAKDQAEKIFYVNPKKDVTIPIADPEANATYTFKEWKMGANADGAVYNPSTAQRFTNDLTVITATYEETENIIPYDPSVPDPMVRPEGYVRVTFAADPGLKLKEQKAYYVKANAGITLGDDKLVKPGYEEETGYKFDKWDKADDTEITNADIVVTAKATKLDKVIPEKDYKGKPNEKPEGYKEVTFVVKDGDEGKGSINGVNKFYVNPTEYVTINPPATKAETGYEFGAWDKDATIPTVYEENTTITGSFNGLKDAIPKTNPDGSENKQPDGYKTVTFVIDPATGGKIADGEVKVYYVNPAKEVTVPQPKTQADTGYEFDKWDTDTTTAKKYTADTIVKGNFKKLKDIIPGTNDKGENNPKPEGYVTLTFEKGDHGSLTGKTVYYVNPKAGKTLGDTSIVKPKVIAETGYNFTGWDTEDSFEIKIDKTVKAQYKEIDDVIPKTKTDESEKPEGYITVTFEKGDHGELEGNTTFYVNPNKAVVLEGKDPTIKPNTGYTSAGWDTSINKAIQYKDGDKITALYNELGDVIPQEKTDGSDKPIGYLTVTFDKGEHGKEMEGKTVYYVKPNKEVTVPAPTVTPDVGYKQKDGTDAWDKPLTQTFTEDTKITAQYEELKNIIPGDQTKPDGYFTVEFKAENGSLDGTTTYFVKPNVEVNLKDKADTLTKNPDVGYTAEGGIWDKEISSKTYAEDETYTFKFKELEDIIPGDQTTERPNGYVKVEFRSDINGSLEGNTIFYVNPNAKKTMQDITPLPTIKANKGYKVGNPNWHQDFTNDTTEIKEDRIYVANYEALGEAKITYIPRDPEMGSVSPGSEYLSDDEEIKGSTATENPGYEFVKWVDADENVVSKEKTFKPTEKVSAVYIAVFKSKGTATVEAKKIWDTDENVEYPTMNFTLYRKVEESQDEPVEVEGENPIEINKEKTNALWTNLPKEDAEGKTYEYSVKETFKDESDVRNANWILGQMETDDAGNNTITNKLKTVPGENDSPDEKQHRMGKLTITKKIESKPILEKVMSMFRAEEPMEFTFKVTDPYGKDQTFTLKAGESKELNNLFYGEYTVEETDTKGLTPFVKIGESDETESKTAKVTLTKDIKEGTVTFTNKNVKPSNPNIIEVKATKIWSGGPSTDHTAIDLKLYRQVGDGEKEAITDAKAETSRDAKDISKFNYVWKDLPKINDEGKEYTYSVEEANVNNGEVKVGDNTYKVSQEGNTITNTYQASQTEVLIGKKVWENIPEGTKTPTIKLELWRKTSESGKADKVVDAKALDEKNQVNFGKQDFADKDGNKYIYFVREVDEDGTEFNDSSYTSEINGLTVINTKKAVVAKDGKLKITKKLENLPKRMARYSTRSVEPIKFKFEVTGPDGFAEEFELEAGESKSFDKLTHGKYFVKEVEKHGYTPYFAIGEGAQTQTERFEVSIESADEVDLVVTNKNAINPNDLTVRATKIWKGGPKSDHTAVKLQLLRTSEKAGSSQEDVTNEYRLETRNDDTSDTITYVWKNLPKHDPDGYKYTYEVQELGVGEDKIYQHGENSYRSEITKDTVNTVGETIAFDITNTYIVPKTEQDVIAYKQWINVPEGVQKPQVKFQLRRKIAGGEAQDLDIIKEVEGRPNDQGLIEVNFGKQDKTDRDGKLYHYFVRELDENGNEFNNKSYQVIYSEDVLTVTNKYKKQVSEPKLVDVVAYKQWVGVPGDAQKPKVYFQLMRKAYNEEAKEVGNPVEVTGPIDENGFIKVDFGMLEKLNDKNYIYSYYVVELDENGNRFIHEDYDVEYNNEGLTVVNTYNPGNPNPGPTPDPDPTPDPNPEPEPNPEPGPGPSPEPNPDPEPGPDPEPNPNPEPGPSPEPSPEPGPGPSPEPNPDPEPGPGPSPEPNPGEEPGDKPDKDPDDKPGIKPGEKPEDKPGEEPEDVPGVIPGGDSSDKPGEKPGETPGESPENPKPQKPEENIPEKPPVKTENNKTNQTGTKIVKTINQTGTKIVRNVKNFLNPSTGIITNYEIYIGLMAASSVGLFFTREKKNKDEE